MTDLTSQLQTRQGPSAPVAVPQGGTNPLGAAAGLASTLFGGLADQDRNRRSQQQWEWQQGEHKRQARIDEGRDDAAGLELRARMGIQARIDELGGLQAGVEQGNVPRVRLDVAVRNEVESLYAQYPEARAEIGAMFRESGFDDLLFRETNIAIASENAQLEAYNAQRTAWFEVTTQMGIDTTNMSFDEAVNIGRQTAELQQATALARQERELQISEQRADNETRRIELRELENRSMTAAVNLANSFMTPHLRNARDLVVAAGESPEALAELQRTWPELVTNLRVTRSQLLSDPNLEWSADAVEHFTSYTDGLIDDFASVMVGPEGVPAQRIESINTLAELTESDLASTMPTYFDMEHLLGRATLQSALNGMDPLTAGLISEDVRAAIQAEMRGYQTAAVDRYNDSMATIDNILNNGSSIVDVNPELIPTVAASMIAITRATSSDIAANGITEDNADEAGRFGAAYAQLLVLSEGFTPGQTDAREVRTFAQAAFSPEATNTVNAMMEDEQTRPMAERILPASRRAAESALFALSRDPVPQDLRFQGIRLNAEGRYEPYFDTEARLRFNAGQMDNPGGVTIPENRNIDPRIRRQAEAMNMAVDYLVNTDAHDTGMPSEATTRSRRMFWASQGQAQLVDASGAPAGPRRDMTEQQSVTQANADQAFQDALRSYQQSTREGLAPVDPSDNAATARPATPTGGQNDKRPASRSSRTTAANRTVNQRRDIQAQVIAMEENRLTGYIPTAESGVTIAAGFDLGQHSPEQIQAMGLPEELTQRLLPFAGLSTQQAVEEAGLDPSSLTISDADAQAINDYFVSEHVSVVQDLPAAANLSNEALAVAASLRHWAGALGNSNKDGKLNPNGTNYVWEVLNNPEGTDEMMIDALIDTLAELTPGTAASNRIRRELGALRQASR